MRTSVDAFAYIDWWLWGLGVSVFISPAVQGMSDLEINVSFQFLPVYVSFCFIIWRV